MVILLAFRLSKLTFVNNHCDFLHQKRAKIIVRKEKVIISYCMTTNLPSVIPSWLAVSMILFPDSRRMVRVNWDAMFK